MAFTRMIREMQEAGLLDFSSDVPQLTDKGRDYLQVLDDAQTREVAEIGEDATDLMMSTTGLFR